VVALDKIIHFLFYEMVFSSHDAKDHSYFEGLNIENLFLVTGAPDEFQIINHISKSIRLIVQLDNFLLYSWNFDNNM